MNAKVFVIGFQKTGTTSMELALEQLGYKVVSGVPKLMDFTKDEERKSFVMALMENNDAVQDMPWPLFYKELYEWFPEAKFILTIRNTESWIKSVVKYFASIRIPLHKKIYQVPCAEGYEERYIEVYEKHNRAVMEYFKDSSNFLVMESGKNFDYDTLCTFLNIPDVPDGAFPHQRNNAKRSLPNYKLYRDLRSLYWNVKKKY